MYFLTKQHVFTKGSMGDAVSEELEDATDGMNVREAISIAKKLDVKGNHDILMEHLEVR